MEKVWKPWDLEGVECGRRSWIPLMLAVGPRRLVNIHFCWWQRPVSDSMLGTLSALEREKV